MKTIKTLELFEASDSELFVMLAVGEQFALGTLKKDMQQYSGGLGRCTEIAHHKGSAAMVIFVETDEDVKDINELAAKHKVRTETMKPGA